MHTPHYVELALCADDTVLIATSHRKSLLVSYLGRPEHWLRDWKIAVNVCRSATVLFAKTARRIQKPRLVHFFRRANTVSRNSTTY
jgi:hypothetical protein